ncbi:hypothetical protein ATANTOWER_018307 [Ataeniobius toweri]|uniref:Uncharacterized protein n=1 Tax=Ataeniobius toweri TaxID=208326 RepID=A0ABU7BJP1_9TELE|nr:hypothetical protein [Ataeniobius toweri]
MRAQPSIAERPGGLMSCNQPMMPLIQAPPLEHGQLLWRTWPQNWVPQIPRPMCCISQFRLASKSILNARRVCLLITCHILVMPNIRIKISIIAKFVQTNKEFNSGTL